jgi:hypothetical protein
MKFIRQDLFVCIKKIDRVKFFFRLLLVLTMLLNKRSTDAQCLDVFGRTVECPTENDSLLVYNSAIKVYEFYEKNPNYIKIKSIRLRTKQSVIDCFYQLQDALDSFNVRWQLRERVIGGEDLPYVLMPKNGQNLKKEEYYQYVDVYRFYQREFENGILNTFSPFPIYDIRIAPLLINSYENRTSYDDFSGDFVNIALYIPVTIKPVSMLSDSERVVRDKILQGNVSIVMKSDMEKRKSSTIPKNLPAKKMSDTSLLASAFLRYELPPVQKINIFTRPPSNAIPFHDYTLTKGGCLIGYMIGRKFRKFLPTDEYYNVLPQKIKNLLSNDSTLEKYLKIRLGSYYNGLYK